MKLFVLIFATGVAGLVIGFLLCHSIYRHIEKITDEVSEEMAETTMEQIKETLER